MLKPQTLRWPAYLATLEAMDINIAEAGNQFTKLIRADEDGEAVVITRNGKPVAQLTPPPAKRKRVVLSGIKDSIKLLPGWDELVNLDPFLQGDF